MPQTIIYAVPLLSYVYLQSLFMHDSSAHTHTHTHTHIYIYIDVCDYGIPSTCILIYSRSIATRFSDYTRDLDCHSDLRKTFQL
jgi:hypothetical protein